MRWTGHLLLIVLVLFSLGCFRGDWIGETLTLVDVTGTWEGSFRFNNVEQTTRWVLQQNGSKVRGEAQGVDGAPWGPIEGLVKGEVFSWRATGRFAAWNPSPRAYNGEATVTGDELNGRASGWSCPCTLLLRRVNNDSVREKKAQ